MVLTKSQKLLIMEHYWLVKKIALQSRYISYSDADASIDDLIQIGSLALC